MKKRARAPAKKSPAKKTRAAKTGAKKKSTSKVAKKAAPRAKYEAKTKQTAADVDGFIAGADAKRQADAKALVAMMERVSGEKAKMWGPSIVGFGKVHYKYASGHEGDMPLVGFSPRKGALVLYMGAETFAHPLMAQLGKHKTGKGCLYLNSLADVDVAVLEQLIKASAARSLAVYSA